jgi:carbonic anhydrase
VRSRLHTHKITIHGWIYNIEDGSVVTYDRENHTFVPLFETYDPDSDSGVYEQLRENYRGSSRLSQTQRDRIYYGSPTFYA